MMAGRRRTLQYRNCGLLLGTDEQAGESPVGRRAGSAALMRSAAGGRSRCPTRSRRTLSFTPWQELKGEGDIDNAPWPCGG